MDDPKSPARGPSQSYQVHLDFLYDGGLGDFAGDVLEGISKDLEGAQPVGGSLNGRLHFSSERGGPVSLGDRELYHGNITLELKYQSSVPLADAGEGLALEAVEAVMPRLNSGRCALLRNEFSKQYLLAKAEEIKREMGAVALMANAQSEVPIGFSLGIMLSQAVDME